MKELLSLTFVFVFLTVGVLSVDNSSVTPSTTPAETSVSSHNDTTTPTLPNTTSIAPKPTTTSAMTTTSPGPGKFRFDNCSALYATISINSKSQLVNVPASSNVSGYCGNKTSNMTLTWDTHNFITFSFLNENGTVYLENVAINLENNTANQPVHEKLSSDKAYYTCKETLLHVKNYNVSLTGLKVQVFHYNSTFSDTGEDCDAATTVAPTSPIPSSTPKPTPTPSPMRVNYTVHGFVNGTMVLCLLMDAAIEFKIPYEGIKKNETYNGVISKLPSYTGTCDFNTDTLKITTGAVTLDFIFKNVAKRYSISELKLTADTKKFKDSKGGIIAANYTNKKDFQLNVGEYYFCNSKTTLQLSSNVEVSITHLKLEAFKTTNSSTTDGKMVLCPADQSTNSIVPIAVGAALAGLVVVVLIAYLIGRKRSRRGYESV